MEIWKQIWEKTKVFHCSECAIWHVAGINYAYYYPTIWLGKTNTKNPVAIASKISIARLFDLLRLCNSAVVLPDVFKFAIFCQTILVTQQ